MKDLLKILPQILSYLPEVLKYARYFKYIPILALIGAIGYGAYYLVTIYKDPYKCFHNEIYERMSIDSNVYKFKGGYCVNIDDKENPNTNNNEQSSEED